MFVVNYIQEGEFQKNMAARLQNSGYLRRNEPWFFDMFEYGDTEDDIEAAVFKWQKMSICLNVEAGLIYTDIDIEKFNIVIKKVVERSDAGTEV